MINHIEVPEMIQLEVEETDAGRFYISPNGKRLPSITTVLGYSKEDGLKEWRERVGEAEAQKIMNRAATRGTAIHDLAETYLYNKPINYLKMMPALKQVFIPLRKELDKINNIHYLEAPLYSEKLGVAGRCDCIAEYDGFEAIIDFKTSLKTKKENWITGYFEQVTGYSLMYEERTGIKIEKGVVIIANDNQYGDEPVQVFIINRSDYVESLQTKIRTYYKDKGLDNVNYTKRFETDLYDERIDGVSVP